MRYDIASGVKRAKIKIQRLILGLAVLAFPAALALSLAPVEADSLAIDFEDPPYITGTINSQDGWSSLGAAGSGCAIYDHEVVINSYSITSFEGQSLRMSNAVTSGCFGDQTFSKSLTNEAGEATAQNGGMSGGVRQNHFEARWDFASTVPDAEQPGLSTVASPDRGDGARMSWVQMADTLGGLDVNFFNYKDVFPFGTLASPSDGCGVGDDFMFSPVATGLARNVPHTIKVTMDLLDGPGNDVVKVYVDGVLEHTDTSWEDYFRWCTESGGGVPNNPVADASRTVDSILFRTGGAAALATDGSGFLIDNLSLSSSMRPAPHVTGGLTLGVGAEDHQQISFNAFNYGVSNLDKGRVEYQNFDYPGGLHYTANIKCATVSGKNARFMFQIPDGFPGLSELYVVVSVHDGGSPGTNGDTYGHTATADLATALSWCETGIGVTSYTITGGNLVVHKN